MVTAYKSIVKLRIIFRTNKYVLCEQSCFVTKYNIIAMILHLFYSIDSFSLANANLLLALIG